MPTDVPATIEELNLLIGIDWSDIPSSAMDTTDTMLGFDSMGDWKRSDIATLVSNRVALHGISSASVLWPAFPGSTIDANQTTYGVLAQIEAAIEAIVVGPGSGLNWLDAWSGVTAYVEFDAVSHNGSSWIANAGSTNKEPGVDPEWDLMAQKGDTGDTGATGPAGADGADGAGVTWLGDWSNVTAYVANDAVEYNGSSYIANAPNTNKIPGTDPEWDLWVSKGDPGAGATPVTATVDGIQIRTGWMAGTVTAEVLQFAGTVTAYTINELVTDITAAGAAFDGWEIAIYINSAGTLSDENNIKLKPNLGAIVQPSGGAMVWLKYIHSLGQWWELDRHER